MKNIEKYFNKLVELDSTAIGLVDGKIEVCAKINCDECEFKCSYANFYGWLASEYKEPILNEKEKEILIKLIETNKAIYNTDVLFVEKLSTTNNFSKCYLYIMFENRNSSETITFYSDTIFSRMELNKQYTLKDLGLC